MKLRKNLKKVVQKPSVVQTELGMLIRECSGDPTTLYRLESDHELLPHEEICMLSRRFRSGHRESGEKIVVHNLRLVASIARSFLYSGIPILDLIQEGNIGLLHAVRKFDPGREIQFSTYATWWIRAAIGKSVAESGTVRLPGRIRKLIRQVWKEEKGFLKEFGRSPTEEELSERTGIGFEELAMIRGARSGIVSLDEPIGSGDSDDTGYDRIAGSYDDLHRPIEQEQHAKLVSKLLDVLSGVEREIVERMYGLNGYDNHDIPTVSESMGIPRHSVNQRFRKAMRKLTHLAGGVIGDVHL